MAIEAPDLAMGATLRLCPTLSIPWFFAIGFSRFPTEARPLGFQLQNLSYVYVVGRLPSF
jgi:hypothetical protein